jgi:amidohydrolase
MGNLNQKFELLIKLRRQLHKHPEISGKEFKTAKRIIAFLENYSPDEIISEVGKTGIIAIYNGIKPGKTVMFRCELDALPIQEINTFEHRSLTNGVSHKCGHDGHMAILCGLAIELSQNRPDSGTVVLLFQPAEENGKGAKKVFSNSKFLSLKPDFVFALHNLPGFTKNQIVFKNGTFTCAVNSIIIKLNGKTAHAGEPENGINPALAIATITTQFDAITQTDISKENYCLITPVYIKMGGKAYGVSAGSGEIHFTIRSNSNSKMKKIETSLENIAQTVADKYQLKCTINWTESFEANENNITAINFIKKAAEINNLELLEKENPFSWGEDFGLYTQHYSGALFGIGSGENIPALHNPDYDFPDAIIPSGVSIFYQISKQITDAH